MADHNDFGNAAEDLAVEFLVKKEYHILCRNYRFQKAEIDIIAQKDAQIIIVEVKARGTDIFLEPHEAVTKKKIKLLVTAADEFMREMHREENVRFDIISVLPNRDGILEIMHIEDAFNAIDAN